MSRPGTYLVSKKTGRAYQIYPTKCPRMTNCFGRTWDVVDQLEIDGFRVKSEIWMDTTWSPNMYCQIGLMWYKMNNRILDSGDGKVFEMKKIHRKELEDETVKCSN